MKVIDFENFLLHPDLAVAEAAISGGPILVSGCRAGTAVILSLDAYNELKAAGWPERRVRSPPKVPGIRALKHHNSDIFPLIPAVVLQKWWIPDGIRRVPREKGWRAWRR